MTPEQIRDNISQILSRAVKTFRENQSNIRPKTFEISHLSEDPLFWPNREEPFSPSLQREIAEVLYHQFILTGIVMPGNSYLQAGIPQMTITEYGEECLIDNEPLPYDPAGYVRALKAKIPDIDIITLAYIGEAVSSYNHRNLLSATVMLGVASESLMILLIESYVTTLPSEQAKKLVNKLLHAQIASIYKSFMDHLNPRKEELPSDLKENYSIYLDGIFNFIRVTRNDAGHPTGNKLSDKVIASQLQVFYEYSSYLMNLKRHFDSQTLS